MVPVKSSNRKRKISESSIEDISSSDNSIITSPHPSDNRQVYTYNNGMTIYDQTEEGRRNYAGPGSWYAEVSQLVPGLSPILQVFDRMRQKNGLDCARPSVFVSHTTVSNVLNGLPSASVPLGAKHLVADSAHNKPESSVSNSLKPGPMPRQIGFSFTQSPVVDRDTSWLNVVFDPRRNGMNSIFLADLLEVYHLVIHPFNNILDWDSFINELGINSKWIPDSASNRQPRTDVIYIAIIWLILAHAIRVLPKKHKLLESAQNHLRKGTLCPKQDPVFQQSAKFVAEPSEFFLTCAERCLTRANILTDADDLGSLVAVGLYVSLLHDGSTRTWTAWTLHGLAVNMIKRMGLDRTTGSVITAAKEDNDAVSSTRRQLLFVVINNIGQNLAVDLGQYYNPFAPSTKRFPILQLQKSEEQEFEVLKFQINQIVKEIMDSIYFQENESISLVTLNELDMKLSRIRSSIPEMFSLKNKYQRGESSKREREDSNSLESSSSPSKLLFQRYILDTMLQKAQFLLYRPYLKNGGGSDETFGSEDKNVQKALQAAKALLENQLQVAHDQRLSAFTILHWTNIHAHAFQAALILALHVRKQSSLSPQMDPRNDWKVGILDQCWNLYYELRAHSVCASAKAHVVLSYILGLRSKIPLTTVQKWSVVPFDPSPQPSPNSSSSVNIMNSSPGGSDNSQPGVEEFSKSPALPTPESCSDDMSSMDSLLSYLSTKQPSDSLPDVFDVSFFPSLLGDEFMIEMSKPT